MTKDFCSLCGEAFDSKKLKELNGQKLCDSCYAAHTTVCDSCGTRILTADARFDGHITLCQDCFNSMYTTCTSCGRMILEEDAYYYSDHSDDAYCVDCYEEAEEDDEIIQDYSFKPEPIFYGSGIFFMGVELELDKGGESIDNAETLLYLANQTDERIYCKHDGSINDGFEIVSHPMTLDYHMCEMNWPEIFRRAVSMGYRSHQTETCGLHIHVSRSALGESDAEQEEAIARIVYFVENHWNELLRFSRRTEYAMSRWANRYGISTTTKDTYQNAKDKQMGRYAAVNLENEATIEFRIFRGTLCYNTFLAALQLVYEICRFAVSLSDQQMERLSWSEFVVKISPEKTALLDYLKSKRLYVNEETKESEEL